MLGIYYHTTVMQFSEIVMVLIQLARHYNAHLRDLLDLLTAINIVHDYDLISLST